MKTVEQLGIEGDDLERRAERINRIRAARAKRLRDERAGKVTASIVWNDESGRYSYSDLSPEEQEKYDEIAARNAASCHAIEKAYEEIYGRQVVMWREGDEFVVRDYVTAAEICRCEYNPTITLNEIEAMMGRTVVGGKLYWQGSRRVNFSVQ